MTDVIRSSRRPFAAIALIAFGALAGCAPAAKSPDPAVLERAAERYVKLALALGRHDPDYVDAYYGPPEWKVEADHDSISLARIRAEADSIVGALAGAPAASPDSLWPLRHRYVRAQLAALSFRTRMLEGEKPGFDAESKALSDVVAPPVEDSTLAPALAALDSLLPGPGPLTARLEAYRRRFVIPPKKFAAVFDAAIAEARRRTKAHLALPDSETFTVEYVKDQPWSGYNWYQGGARSLIQVNTDLPIYIDRAIDLACHEGYPGHHVYNLLLERALARERGWREFQIYPLYSPQSLIAEGTAVVAPEIAFPGEERTAFEKGTLFPLAGLDPREYDRYARVREALEGLAGFGTENARQWLDGHLTREQAIERATTLGLRTKERAEKDLSFAGRYRTYVVNYWLGRKIVNDWLAANGGDEAHPDRRWSLYETLLASPRLPADLTGAAR